MKNRSSGKYNVYRRGIIGICISGVLLLQGCHHAVRQDDRLIIAEQTEIDPTKSLFPLSVDATNVDRWIDPDDANYKTPVLTTEEQRALFQQLKNTYFGQNEGDASPWNPSFVQQKLAAFSRDPETKIIDIEQHYLHRITHPDTAIYGENFRLRTAAWKYLLAFNTHIQQFLSGQSYQEGNRAIAVRRSDVRTLPTADPVFENPREAGQGYPFDQLQNSSLAPATPVYILGESRDLQWVLIMAPEVLGWVKADDIARVDNGFVHAWRIASDLHLGAIIDHQVPVLNQYFQPLFNAPAGTILPVIDRTDDAYVVYLPVKDAVGRAQIQQGYVSTQGMRQMPWQATPQHFSVIMRHMVGLPYGWGGLLGNNDCSAELRQLMMPFGVFLPRNSWDQSQSGKASDQSKLAVDDRINYLMEHGKPFRSMVYIGGHIMLYLGNREYNGKKVPMTYQNIWGLRPADGSRRSIIGQSVFFPLLESYEEDTALQSLAAKKWFVITDIGERH